MKCRLPLIPSLGVLDTIPYTSTSSRRKDQRFYPVSFAFTNRVLGKTCVRDVCLSGQPLENLDE